MYIILYNRLDGVCVPYSDAQITQPSICDSIFQAGTDYVYYQNSRMIIPSELRVALENYSPVVEHLPEPCNKVIASLVCIRFLSPCGHNSLAHVPTFICPDVCEYVSTELCPSEWAQAEAIITLNHGAQFAVPNCSRSGEHLEFLSLSGDCCTNGNVTLPG